ncbi:hypothetical protein [Pseudaestuariivita sp.]|uniref:hypothetical protein n=1 Tax=Pseudaestuariivita sp. TaxID=2211669 RepID=UPI004059BC31
MRNSQAMDASPLFAETDESAPARMTKLTFVEDAGLCRITAHAQENATIRVDGSEVSSFADEAGVSADVFLTAGNHLVEVDYREAHGAAPLKMSMVAPEGTDLMESLAAEDETRLTQIEDDTPPYDLDGPSPEYA